MRREVPFAHAIVLFCVTQCQHRLGLKTYEQVVDVADLYNDFENRFRSAIGLISSRLS